MEWRWAFEELIMPFLSLVGEISCFASITGAETAVVGRESS
jgi:hypothetical protein